MQAKRKLNRSKNTGAILTPDGAWTTEVAKAEELQRLEKVRAVSDKHDPADGERCYAFGEKAPTQYNFTTPLCLDC